MSAWKVDKDNFSVLILAMLCKLWYMLEIQTAVNAKTGFIHP